MSDEEEPRKTFEVEDGNPLWRGNNINSPKPSR
jgi:hypothetical protein